MASFAILSREKSRCDRVVRTCRASNEMAVEDLNCDDLGQYLTDNGCHEEVVVAIISNRINGKLLLEL